MDIFLNKNYVKMIDDDKRVFILYINNITLDIGVYSMWKMLYHMYD